MNSLLSGDVQVKSMEQTVKYAEQHLGEICSLMASYTRKTAKLRDKADLLVAQVFDFSSTEGTGVQIGLKNIAEDLAMVQDYRQAQVERLETQVVAPLKAYGDIVKNKRADLKKHSVDVNKELKELQKLERIQLRNPADRQSISQAEVNAQKASTNAQRSIRQLEETIEDFQRQKLEDVKRIFTDFITLEMVFHAKALEIYTHTYHNLEAINTQRDLESCSTLQCQRGMKEDEEEEEEEEEVEEKEEKDFSRSVTEEGHLISRPSYTARRDQLRRWNSTES